MDLLQAFSLGVIERLRAETKMPPEAHPLPREGEDVIAYWIRVLRSEAWDEGYVAGNAFGYDYAQDTYDGPVEDPTRNPYGEASA